MSQWAERSESIKQSLKLRSEPIAFRRLQDATGKTSVAIPCYGERALGQVADDEITVALPPGELDRAIDGLATLAKVGFGYPISSIGAFTDPLPFLGQIYTDRKG
jgi:uncharacterized protein (DUF169 family)